MDKLLRNPKLARETQRQGWSHNFQAVCITLKDDNEKQKKDGNKQQKKSSKKVKHPPRNRPRTQKTLNVGTDYESDSVTCNEKPKGTATETTKWKRTANTEI